MKIGYARVSIKDQSLSMQVDALKQAGCTQIHEEIASGTKTTRPVLDEIIRNLREEDILFIRLHNVPIGKEAAEVLYG